MKSEKKIRLPQKSPFDSQFLMNRLEGNFRAPRNKIQRLCDSGEIIRIKKGLYISGSVNGDSISIDPQMLAPLIFGPSYISLESALAWYGIIPERVSEITSVTTKRAKFFATPVGNFRYSPISERAFPIGYRMESTAGGSFFLAEPEKALCDRIAQVKGTLSQRDIGSLIRDDLRIDIEALAAFRLPLVSEIAVRYHRKNVSTFHRWLKKQIVKK